jgi:hypothetical protein
MDMQELDRRALRMLARPTEEEPAGLRRATIDDDGVFGYYDELDDEVYIREELEELAAESAYEEAPALMVLPVGWPVSKYELGQEVSVVADGGCAGMITGIKLDLTDGRDVQPCATWMYRVGEHWWEARELCAAEPEEEQAASTTDDFDAFLDADDLP